MKALPPDAAINRAERLPPTEEFLAVLVETTQNWAGVHLDALLGARKVRPPGAVHIERPGDELAARREVETDPARIAAFFGAPHITA